MAHHFQWGLISSKQKDAPPTLEIFFNYLTSIMQSLVHVIQMNGIVSNLINYIIQNIKQIFK